MKIMRLIAILIIAASCAKARVIQNFSLRQSKVVIAHRGASGVLPEHTREAFVWAHSSEANFIEADVVSSKDGVLFALHDLTLEATTDVAKRFPTRARSDGKFYAIDFNASELRQLTVHERVHPETGEAVFPGRFGPKVAANFKLATLDELIQLLIGLNESRNKSTGLYIEPKRSEFHTEHKIDLIAKVQNSIKEARALAPELNIIVESFNPQDLKTLKFDYKVDYPLVQLIGENSWSESSIDYQQMITSEGTREVAKYADGIGPWIYQLLRPISGQVVVTNLAHHARENGLFIHSYTVRADSLPPFAKSYDQLLEMLYLGVKVDGIFTDQPSMAVSFLNRYSASNRTIKGK